MDAKEPLIRIVLLALLLYAACCLASTKRDLAAAGMYEASLKARLAVVEKDNLAVSERLTEGWSTEELEQLAWERLGLVLPGEKIFRFISDSRDGAH